MVEDFRKLPFPARSCFSQEIYSVVCEKIRDWVKEYVFFGVKPLEEKLKKEIEKEFKARRFWSREEVPREKVLKQRIVKLKEINRLGLDGFTHFLTSRRLWKRIRSEIKWELERYNIFRWEDFLYSVGIAKNPIGMMICWYAKMLGFETKTKTSYTFYRPWSNFFSNWLKYPKGSYWFREVLLEASFST